MKKIIAILKKLFHLSHPALRIIERLRNINRQVHVALLSVDSALLALENIELPLAASPPIPSPFGLWRSTKKINTRPLETQTQVITEISMLEFFKQVEEFEKRSMQFLLSQLTMNQSLRLVWASLAIEAL